MADADSAPGAGDVPEGTWSVAEVNEAISSVIDEAADRFPSYVVGEVSDVSRYEFGTFFDLRDRDGEAVVSCLAWSYAVDGFDGDLEPGAAGVVRASVDYHAEKGNLQLLVDDYWPLGESGRAQELEALRATLDEEGLLDEDRKRDLPRYPACVGVVTSLAGSAREDVRAAIHDRAPGVDVKLHGATVQGERAVRSVVAAVDRLDADPAVDVIVVTRGGGADADLWSFNAEPLVRRVADCRTHVVAAIGHEDDRTLVEDVADRRCMTPTDAGVTAVPEMRAVRREVGDLERRVESAYRNRVARDLDALETRIDRAYREREADARVAAGTAEARRLRVAVAVLLALLLLGGVAVAALVLGVV